MQRLLFIDTSGPVGAVALGVDGIVAVVRTNTETRDHAAVVNGMIEAVLREAGSTLAELNGVCVLAGPGSYTGLRIALATAKGLCYTLELPLLLQNTLDVLVAAARKDLAHPGDNFLALIKARSGEYFFATYTQDGNAVVEPRHGFGMDVHRALDGMGGRLLICGLKEAAQELSLPAPCTNTVAINVDAWVAHGFLQAGRSQWADLAYAEPFYLKPAFTTSPRRA